MKTYIVSQIEIDIVTRECYYEIEAEGKHEAIVKLAQKGPHNRIDDRVVASKNKSRHTTSSIAIEKHLSRYAEGKGR